jgi:hypothetical protein
VRAAAVGALAFLFPMAACGRSPTPGAPADAKPVESKRPVAAETSSPILPAPAPQPAPPSEPKAPDAVAPTDPKPPESPDPPEPKRTETIGKI